MRDDLLKLAPSGIQDALVQTTFCCRTVGEVRALLILLGFGMLAAIGNLPLLKDESLMLLYQLLGLLVMEVATLSAYLAMSLCYHLTGFVPSMQPFFLTGYGLLATF